METRWVKIIKCLDGTAEVDDEEHIQQQQKAFLGNKTHRCDCFNELRMSGHFCEGDGKYGCKFEKIITTTFR